MDMAELARRGGVWIALIVLGISAILFLFAVDDIVETWFKHQYVPIARAVMALFVGGGAVAVIWRLTRK